MADYHVILSALPHNKLCGCLSTEMVDFNEIVSNFPKYNSKVTIWNELDLVPFEFKEVYMLYCLKQKYDFTWLENGLIIYGEMPKEFISNEFIMILHSSKTYTPGARHIGMEYSNKKTEEYLMVNQRYYKLELSNYVDYCTPGLTLPEIAYWLQCKIRKRYFMLFSHLMIEFELPNFKEIICSIFNIAELATGLELGFYELATLGLLPQQILFELLLRSAFNMSDISNIIAESLGLEPNEFINYCLRPAKVPNYIDMLAIGSSFSKHFDNITQYIWNVTKNIEYGWEEFPKNLADAMSDTYNWNNQCNRNKFELEKLIIWKLHGFNTKHLYWLINQKFTSVGIFTELTWKPPLTIYSIKELGNPTNTHFLRDTGSGYEIKFKNNNFSYDFN